MVRLVPVTSGEAPRRLGRLAGQVRESADCWAPDPEIERLFHSAASVRELELKAAIGKLELPEAWQDGAEETGFPELPVGLRKRERSAQLPPHHRDPFDRVLVAQAREHGLRIATRDPWILAYQVPVIPV